MQPEDYMAFHKNGYSVNVRLPKDVFLTLKRKAKSEDMSMSYIMRRALKKSGELSDSKTKKAVND